MPLTSVSKLFISLWTLIKTGEFLQVQGNDLIDSACRSLDLGELQKMIDRLGINNEVSPENLKSVFRLCDVDHDGAISLKEFVVTLSLLYLLRAVPTLVSVRSAEKDANDLVSPPHSVVHQNL